MMDARIALRDHHGLTAGSGELLRRYLSVRRFSETICEPLEPEDCVIQSMPDVSPTRWHLAHTTWFFETLILAKASRDYHPFHPDFTYLFNSYYNTVGEQFPRPNRGVLSRPTLSEILGYRRYVDDQMQKLLDAVDDELHADLLPVMEIGINHEQQHQELMLTDIKHVLSCNPLYPVYREVPAEMSSQVTPLCWAQYDEGLCGMGHKGSGFAFDNESPRHRVFVESFEFATRLTTNGEYQEFLEDGGYDRPELWLSAGWGQVCTEGWKAPLYWVKQGDEWWQFTLSGLRRVNPAEPVCHVSYFEADAFARWADARLPTEADWEVAAGNVSMEGNFVEDGFLHPVATASELPSGTPTQMFGDVWEWTASPYTPYPGYAPPAGPLGEYNGKFMCNQYVLRGGSCATPKSHIRRTYRNFFPPEARWQFSGIRLVK